MAQSYDAVMLLTLAIKQANSTDGPKIREALAASRGFPRTDPEWNRILFGTDEKVWTG